MIPVRRYIRILLPIAVLIALFVAFAYYAIGVVDRHNCLNLAEMRFDHIESVLETNAQEQALIIDELRADYTTRARVVSMMISNSPSILETETGLEELRIAVNCDVLSVSDDTGAITHSTTQTNEGQRVDDAFLDGLTNRVFSDVIIEQNTDRTAILVGTARMDSTGIVQLRFPASGLNKLLAATDISAVTTDMFFLKGGTLAILDDAEQYLSHTNNALTGTASPFRKEQLQDDAGLFSMQIDGVSVRVMYRKYNDKTLVCAVPKSELYQRRNTVVIWLIALGLVFLALHALQLNNRLKTTVEMRKG